MLEKELISVIMGMTEEQKKILLDWWNKEGRFSGNK